MAHEIELVSDGEGLAVIGHADDVERFLLSSGLDQAPSRVLDTSRVWSAMGTAGMAAQVGADFVENSGRWVKLTAESAENVRKFGLMASKTPGVSHAMLGQPGNIQKWLQISHAPSALMSGPVALPMLASMLQQQAMQRQMEELQEYLQVIDEKVDDILRGQKDAVLADMIGVDLIIEEALTVRDEVGRVSDVTWSKVQATGATIARTQAYAIRQLDAIAEKLEKKADLGDISRATKEAESQIREWLAVIARTFQLLDGLAVLEIDRVLDATPEDLDSHRLGLKSARQKRLNLMSRTTARLLTQMAATVERANAKVLLHPIEAPAAVKSSNQVATGVLDFRSRLGIESDHESTEARRWSHAALEMRDRVVTSTSEGATAAGRFGAKTVDRATEAFRAVDLDGDGIPDRPRAATAAEEAGAAIKGAAAGVGGAFGTLFKRKKNDGAASDDLQTPPEEGSP